MNYSKFDKINYDTDSEDESNPVNPMDISKSNTASDLPKNEVNPTNKIKKTAKSKEGRLKFVYEGKMKSIP